MKTIEDVSYIDFDNENVRQHIEIIKEYNKILPPKPPTYYRESPKIGRNDLCKCNSGKKYKNCCLNPQP